MESYHDKRSRFTKNVFINKLEYNMKSDTLFMNISSDHVVIFNGENEIFLERNDVEKTM